MSGIVVEARYDENRLLVRLLGGFRMEFNKSADCPVDPEEGANLLETDPTNETALPDQCIIYVEGNEFAKVKRQGYCRGGREFAFFCAHGHLNHVFHTVIKY